MVIQCVSPPPPLSTRESGSVWRERGRTKTRGDVKEERERENERERGKTFSPRRLLRGTDDGVSREKKKREKDSERARETREERKRTRRNGAPVPHRRFIVPRLYAKAIDSRGERNPRSEYYTHTRGNPISKRLRCRIARCEARLMTVCEIHCEPMLEGFSENRIEEWEKERKSENERPMRSSRLRSDRSSRLVDSQRNPNINVVNVGWISYRFLSSYRVRQQPQSRNRSDRWWWGTRAYSSSKAKHRHWAVCGNVKRRE